MIQDNASFTFLHRIEEVELNIEDGRWQSALALALTLPDICGGIAFPEIVKRYRDGRAVLDRNQRPTRDVGNQYIRWFDTYAAPFFKVSAQDISPYICGERCWQLRCEYLHQNKGFANTDDNTSIRFHLGVNCGTSVCQLDRISSDNSLTDIRIDIEQFCRRMCQATRAYYEAVHTALNSDWSVETVLSGADGESLYAYTDTPGVDVALSGNVLTLTLTEAKNVSANVYVQDDNWTKPVKLTHRVTVTNRLPTLRAAAGTLKLNSWFPSETASTGMILSQGNVTLTDVELTPAARKGTAARAESDKLNVYYDADSGEIVAEIADSGIKNGTYSFACTGILESGTEISGGTVRVTVSNTLPRARLSAAMVRLNRQLAGEESIAVKVTLTGGDGYAIEGFEELPDCLDYADGILTATIPNADFTGGSYVLNAIVSRNGETATLPAGVILRVQVYDRAPSFRLTAKGKLDVLNPASEIVYTPRLTNAQGTVTDIRLEGADAELFAAEVVDGVVHLTMAKGCTYSTRTTYKVIPVLTFCGQEVTGSTLSIRVTQSTVKLAKLSNRTVYQSQTAPLVQVLSITSPATAEFGEITLNSRSTAALRNAVEAAGGIEVSGGVVRFPAKAFASLKPGRYTVILDVTPENAAADAKPIQARFTLTVQK